mgnify:CR=1 FL=1
MGGTETIPAKQWTKKLSHEDRKSTKLGSLQVLNADSTTNRTAHPNMDTKTQRRSSSPYSRATGLQLGQRRSNTRPGCQNQRCSLTKHRLDRYANPKLHHCKKPQTPHWKPAQSTKKTRPWTQTGRRINLENCALSTRVKVRAYKDAAPDSAKIVPVALRATCAA